MITINNCITILSPLNLSSLNCTPLPSPPWSSLPKKPFRSPLAPQSRYSGELLQITIFSFYILFPFCIWMFCLHACLRKCLLLWDETVVSCHVSPGNQTQVVWKSSQCFELLIHLSIPSNYILAYEFLEGGREAGKEKEREREYILPTCLLSGKEEKLLIKVK